VTDGTRSHPLSATDSSGVFPGVTESDVMLDEVVTTLAVFYDEVWFPCPYGFDPQVKDFWSPAFPNSQNPYLRLLEAQKVYSQATYDERTNYWKPLFEEGIFKTLPPIDRARLDIPPANEEQYKKQFGVSSPTDEELRFWVFKERLFSYFERQHGRAPLREAIEDVYLTGAWALALHAVFAQKPSAELFISKQSDTSTSRLSGFVVQSLFRYVVPQLNALHPEQILEVRELLKDTKEGFVDYIFEVVDDVEDKIMSGDVSEAEAAHKVVERKLLPKYREMRRQLLAERTGFWSSVLATGSKLLQIDATPWTPKFYGQLIEAFFGPLDKMSEEAVKARSNSRQAFQYIATLAADPPNKVVAGSSETVYRNLEFTTPS
jgi:hypothetical protein